jgi:hypothetical protein
MDDNNNSAVSTTPAAAGGTPPPEGATPTPEQQTTFQKWLAGLFGGKETAPAGQESDPAADKGGSQEPQGKTYTEADLRSEIEKAKAAWAAEQQEQARLAKLTPEERAKAEADAKDQKLADLEAKLLQRDLKDAALAKLEKEGFPVGLADLLTYTDQESMEKSLGRIQEVFKASLETAVKERLRGKTPEGLGGAATAENALKDQIAQNIRGGLN